MWWRNESGRTSLMMVRARTTEAARDAAVESKVLVVIMVVS